MTKFPNQKALKQGQGRESRLARAGYLAGDRRLPGSWLLADAAVPSGSGWG
jgi:hypothetical protein